MSWFSREIWFDQNASDVLLPYPYYDSPGVVPFKGFGCQPSAWAAGLSILSQTPVTPDVDLMNAMYSLYAPDQVYEYPDIVEELFGTPAHADIVEEYIVYNNPYPVLEFLEAHRSNVCLSVDVLTHTVAACFGVGAVDWIGPDEAPSDFMRRTIAEDCNFVIAATRFATDLFVGQSGYMAPPHPDGHQILFYAQEPGYLIAKDSSGNRDGGPEIYYTYEQVDALFANNMKHIFLATYL